MNVEQIIATLNFSLIDLVFVELLLTAIFVVDRDGKIKYTFDYLFGLSKYKASEYYVYGVIILGVTYFYLSNYFQDRIISFLITKLGVYYLSLLFFILLFFIIFWISKVILGRNWNFRLVSIPIIFFIGLTALFIILLAIWPPN
ncbi:MAG: hypothetical protein AABY06_02665 [Nanoarchaeota archaeon]